MRGLVLALALGAVLASLLVPGVLAHDIPPDQLRETVKFDQHVGDQVPLDLAFLDETGQPVTLGSYFGGNRPVVLSLNYFHCQNLCSLELQGLVSGLNGVPFTLGDQYTVVTVSFDPRETPEDAMGAKVRALRGYVHPEAATGWHVLTTDDRSTIDRLTEAVGFHYAYDPQEDDYAHPVGVAVLTPGGQISRYLFGLDFSANDLRLALVDATAGHLGTLLDRALLVCYHYDPLTGRYTPLAWNLVRGGAAAGGLALVGLLIWLWRGELRRPRGGM